MRVTTAALLAAAFVISACGSANETSREAEGTDNAPEPIATADTNPTADTDPTTADTNPTEPAAPNTLLERVTSGGNLGTMVCVSNYTGERTGISVTFTKSDTSNGGPLGPTEERCGEGTFFIGADVEGSIDFSKPGAANYRFNATNPWAGFPNGGAGNQSGAVCLGGDFGIGDAYSYDDGVYSITMSRKPDDKWKQFLIEIRPTSDPSADGKAKLCTGGGGGIPN